MFLLREATKDDLDDLHAVAAHLNSVNLPNDRKVLDGLTPSNSDQKFGIQIVRRALQSPARQIAENAGTDGSIVVGKLTEKGDPNYGFDAQSGDYKDMVGAGIVDPAKVVRVALQDAASVAGLLITTEAMVTDRPEPRTPAGMPHDHGMGDMDY